MGRVICNINNIYNSNRHHLLGSHSILNCFLVLSHLIFITNTQDKYYPYFTGVETGDLGPLSQQVGREAAI